MNEIRIQKRLKSAEDVFRALVDSFGLDIDTASDFLNSIPDTKAEPVRHGRWEGLWNGCCGIDQMHCSVCRHEIRYTDGFKRGMPNYCPNCGAKMDLE